MIGNLTEVFANIVQMFIWTWFVTEFFGYRRTNRIWFFVTWIALVAEITYINYVVPYDGILTTLLIVTMIAYARLCLGGCFYFHVFTVVFSVAIVFVVAGVTLLFLSFFSGLDMTQTLVEFNVWRITALVSCRVFELVIFNAMLRIKDEYSLTRKEWTLFVSMPLLTWLAVVLMMNAAIEASSVKPYMFYLSLIMVAVNILIFYFMIKIKQDAKAATSLKLLQMQYDNIKATEENMKALYDNTYSLKHDLEKHFLAIKAMAQAHKDNDIADYADKILDGSLNASQKIMFTDNDVFNAIINTRIQICAQKEIFPSINVASEALEHIYTEDMAVLFGNVLDNAIEAAELSRDRIIILNVKLQGEYVSVCVENSFDKALSGVGCETNKKNKTEHGYGLKNVRKIVEKYAGLIQFVEEDDMFCCDILLKNNH